MGEDLYHIQVCNNNVRFELGKHQFFCNYDSLSSSEMQKAADAANISVLFFSACAYFWAILGHFWAILAILGQFGQFWVILPLKNDEFRENAHFL